MFSITSSSPSTLFPSAVITLTSMPMSLFFWWTGLDNEIAVSFSRSEGYRLYSLALPVTTTTLCFDHCLLELNFLMKLPDRQTQDFLSSISYKIIHLCPMLLATCTETCYCSWACDVWIGSCLLFCTSINQAVTVDIHIYITNGDPAWCHFSLCDDEWSHLHTGDLPNFTSVNLICRSFKFKPQDSCLFREMFSRLLPMPVSTVYFFFLFCFYSLLWLFFFTMLLINHFCSDILVSLWPHSCLLWKWWKPMLFVSNYSAVLPWGSWCPHWATELSLLMELIIHWR